MGKEKRRLVCVCCGVCVLLVVLVCVCVALRSCWKCSDGRFSHAAIAADSQTCSSVGNEVLQEGGSAVDAAIAALICTGLVNPQSMGLGGGAIFTIMDKNGKVKVISCRETVPKNVTPDLLKLCSKKKELITGPQWIAVPGELRGYSRAHQLFGKLPWARLVQPSIRLAREGFPLPEYLSRILRHPVVTPVVQSSALCLLFCHPNKTLLRAGETLRYPKLAETLETLAQEGPESFYSGRLAEDLVDDIKEQGGNLSLEDLRSFQVRVDEAETVSIGGFQMHIPPLPAGGALISFILNIMYGFGLSPASLQGDQAPLTLHRFIEAAKFANGHKKSIKDPKFNGNQNVGFLMDSGFADRIRAKIRDESSLPTSSYNITPIPDRVGTTHISVLGADGSAVSVTSTINHVFGSAVYSNKTGIILNNELADFCSRADSVSAGEQPPSSMAPTILTSADRERILVIGGSGGSTITTAVAMSIMNRLWLGMSLEDAIAARVVFVDSENAVHLEPPFHQATLNSLMSRNHTQGSKHFFLNVVNAVEREGGCISAVSDQRKDGRAAGY